MSIDWTHFTPWAVVLVAAMRPYPTDLESEITLRDGTRVAVRPMRPSDTELERRFVDGLSERSRFQRFMYHLRELPPAMLLRFTQPDYDRELALVALHGGEFVAVGRYAANPGDDTAEFALVVADAWQGKGLGRVMLEMLIEQARKAGYRELHGSMLESNHEMQKLARRLGFAYRSREGDSLTLALTLANGLR